MKCDFKKIHYWDFENEWRYKINLYGGVFIGKESFINLNRNQIPINSPEYIDVPFEEDILNDLEILIAPCTEDSNIDSLKNFLSKNNIKCKIEKSDIEFKTNKS